MDGILDQDGDDRETETGDLAEKGRDIQEEEDKGREEIGVKIGKETLEPNVTTVGLPLVIIQPRNLEYEKSEAIMKRYCSVVLSK